MSDEDFTARFHRCLFEGLTGAGGVILSSLLVFPIDYVKTQMQLPNVGEEHVTSLGAGMAKIVKTQGFFALYTGVNSEIVKGAVQNFLYIFAYEMLKGYALNQPFFVTLHSDAGNAQKISHTRPLVNASTHCHCHGSNTVGVRYAFRKAKRSETKSEAKKRRGSIYETIELVDSSDLSQQSTDDESLDQSMEEVESEGEYDLIEAKRRIVKVLPINAAPDIEQAMESALKAINDTNSQSNGQPATQPVNQSRPQLTIASNLLVGMVAGCFTQLFVNPLSVIQTRIMTAKKSPNQSADQSMLSTARAIYQNEGFSAFYTGLVPSFILTSNPAIQYLVFDRLKRLIDRLLVARLIDRPISAIESFIIGAVAKIAATLATYPYIMAKLRMQYKAPTSQSPAVKQTTPSVQPASRGTVATILHIIQSEGFTGLYTGLKAQLLKSVLGAALMFMFKEKIAQMCKLLMQSNKSHKHAHSHKKPHNHSSSQSLNQPIKSPSGSQLSTHDQSTQQAAVKTIDTADIAADGQPKQIA